MSLDNNGIAMVGDWDNNGIKMVTQWDSDGIIQGLGLMSQCFTSPNYWGYPTDMGINYWE